MTPSGTLDYLRGFILSESAIVLDPTKDYLIESRLGPVAKDAGLGDLEALAKQLRRGVDSDLRVRVVEALTTNETYFFRDQHPFETFRQTLLPRFLSARARQKSLRIWCAAASTGQEPYSLAMILSDCLHDAPSWCIEIVATDINRSVLDKAREGIYRQHEVNRGLPGAMLDKYFARNGSDWQICPAIRSMVRYEPLNLLNAWPFVGTFDVVFMRNVLIYFDVPTKQAILARTRRHLAHDGVLFLGGAETTVRIDDAYAPAREGSTVYYELRR